MNLHQDIGPPLCFLRGGVTKSITQIILAKIISQSSCANGYECIM